MWISYVACVLSDGILYMLLRTLEPFDCWLGVMIVLYVDDLIITMNNYDFINQVNDKLKWEFEMIDLGIPLVFVDKSTIYYPHESICYKIIETM